MENFIVSARKYRPATFDTVVGQSSITSTLKNAIKNKHLAQAFLFCGPRGVGKTTCARILAKTINCQNKTENIEACDTCESCISFKTSNSLNIFELDAASNNSVEDIRNLVEQVRFSPQLGTHKIYIIDEVHMLSNQAFNAFLKTLEEPPAHAIFILATTEKHKIIPTILSRCQIFDFNRIKIDDIVSHLQGIAAKENVQANPDALHIIAQKADGALRDSLSMFDQIVTFTGGDISYEAVIENLNVLDYDYYFKVTDFILKGNISDCFLLFNEILKKGFDGHNFLTGLASHFRNLLVCKDVATIELLETGENIKEKYKQQSQQCPSPFLLQALNVSNKFDTQYKGSKNQRLLIELMLLNLCNILYAQPVVQASPASQPEKKNEPAYQPAMKQAAPVVKAEPVIEIALPKSLQAPEAYNKTDEPIPAPIVKEDVKPIRKISSPILSINELINPIKTTENISEEKIHSNIGGNNSFSNEQLLNLWKSYAEKMKEQGKMHFYSTLIAHKPELKENFQINFTIDNISQEEDLKLEQTDLLSFLKKELNNNSISINVVLNQDEKKRKFFTSQEKYSRMAEKNHLIVRFKQELDLDIEY
jgi:DNA polymerase III subunit gamma/tau